MKTTPPGRLSSLPLACIACALLTLGCDNSPQHYPVAGTVTLDGEPVPDGEVIFFPLEGGPPDAGPIQAGSFAFQSLNGPMRVQITATRDHPTKRVPGSSPDIWVPAPVNYIPERYRGPESELRVEVPSGGNQQIEFKLQSAP